jgi:hypothetical protein
MDSIFISYRRAGTSGYGGRLQEDLRERFGRERVFRDIDSIRPGTDFVEVIQHAVARAGVVLALIGRNWLTAAASNGHRRIDDPDDFVRIELESAFEQGITVIPVLVEGAEVPSPSELPPSLTRLSRIQAVGLSDERWEYDVGRLVGWLEEIVGPASPVPTESLPSGSRAAVPEAAAVDDTVAVPAPGPAEGPGPLPPESRSGSPRDTSLVEKRSRRLRGRRRWALTVALVAAVVATAVGLAVGLAAAGSGTAHRMVPVVLNQDAGAAAEALQRAGFVVSTRDQLDDLTPPGRVLAQQPPGATNARKGGEVVLWVARSTGRPRVPDVVNMTEKDASNTLRDAGLVPTAVGQSSDAVGPGTVLQQSPAAQTIVEKGSTVTITVSTGPPASPARSSRGPTRSTSPPSTARANTSPTTTTGPTAIHGSVDPTPSPVPSPCATPAHCTSSGDVVAVG